MDGGPAAVLDGLADMQGLLVAAVGPRVDAVATASNFSRETGVLEARIEASNGWLDGTVYGSNNALLIKADQPLRAELELTKPLRERLLYKLHPLLADIRTTEQPLRISIGESSIPLDGDVSRLDAVLEITVGRVEFDSGSQPLLLLTLPNPDHARTTPARDAPPKRRTRMAALESLERRLVLDSTVVFNEVMYHPLDDPNDELEWIELYNQLAIDMDVSEWRLEGGVDFEFPDGTIVPGKGERGVAADAGAPAACSMPRAGRPTRSNRVARLERLSATPGDSKRPLPK